MKMFEIREMTLEELQAALEDAKEELANLRVQKALGQLNNPLRIRMVRREIARLKTVIHEYELGIRKRPGDVKEKA